MHLLILAHLTPQKIEFIRAGGFMQCIWKKLQILAETLGVDLNSACPI